MNSRKLIILIILFFYPYIAMANFVPIGLSGSMQHNSINVNSSGGMLQPTGNQVNYPNLECNRAKKCRGYALEVNFTGTIMSVVLNNSMTPEQQTNECFIIPYWTASGMDLGNQMTNLFENLKDIESPTTWGYLYFDTVNMKTYPIPCGNITGGNINLMLSPSQGWINVGTYTPDNSDSFVIWRKEWFLSEIELYVGALVCSSIPTMVADGTRNSCTQSRPIKTPIGKGSELPEKEPLTCDLSGGGIIDFETVNISEINGLMKEINLNLHCNQDASVEFEFLSNNLNLNGITANLTVNNNKSIIVNANKNQNQNINIKASLNSVNNPVLGDHSASTVLVYSPK